MYRDVLESCCQRCTVCCKCKRVLCNNQSMGFSSVDDDGDDDDDDKSGCP